MLRSAIALSVVIGAILNRAIDALDVLVATSLCLTVVHLDDHPFKIVKFSFRLVKAERDLPQNLRLLPTHILCPIKFGKLHF